jgi:hypothetical protein
MDRLRRRCRPARPELRRRAAEALNSLLSVIYGWSLVIVPPMERAGVPRGRMKDEG